MDDSGPVGGEGAEALYRQLSSGSASERTSAGGCHRVSVGGEHVPRTRLPPASRLLVTLCSAGLLIAGVGLSLAGAMVSGIYDKYRLRHCPAIWWTGMAPVSLSVLGFYTATKKSRRYLFKWGVATILCCVTQTAVMGVVGNFSTALYDVWPLIDSYRGQPLCRVMVSWCYCQDYFHGAYSEIEMPGVQYIHDSSRWKDTGFRHCRDIRRVSRYYFVGVGFYALFALSALCTVVVAFVGSVCAPKETALFSRLEETDGNDETPCTKSSEWTRNDENEMRELQPTRRLADDGCTAHSAQEPHTNDAGHVSSGR